MSRKWDSGDNVVVKKGNLKGIVIGYNSGNGRGCKHIYIVEFETGENEWYQEDELV